MSLGACCFNGGYSWVANVAVWCFLFGTSGIHEYIIFGSKWEVRRTIWKPILNWMQIMPSKNMCTTLFDRWSETSAFLLGIQAYMSSKGSTSVFCPDLRSLFNFESQRRQQHRKSSFRISADVFGANSRWLLLAVSFGWKKAAHLKLAPPNGKTQAKPKLQTLKRQMTR